jgi:hypothetical protein
MEGRVALYLADVVIAALPGSRWICYRGERYNTGLPGHPVLDTGIFPGYANLLAAAAMVFGDILETIPGASPEGFKPEREYTLRGWLELAIQIREEWLAEGRELDFQLAPTGPEAAAGRGPYKGQARGRVDMRSDR